jgi:hypothetical protein
MVEQMVLTLMLQVDTLQVAVEAVEDIITAHLAQQEQQV